MPEYKVNIKVRGHAARDTYRYNFNLGTLVDETVALVAANALSSALNAVTDGVVSEVILQSVVSQDGAVPAYGVNTREQAVITTYLDAIGSKLHNVVIPAPTAAIVLANGEDVNTANADLIAWVDALTAVEVSDGENIDTTLTNGIKEGHTRTVAKSYN